MAENGLEHHETKLQKSFNARLRTGQVGQGELLTFGGNQGVFESETAMLWLGCGSHAGWEVWERRGRIGGQFREPPPQEDLFEA